ncbi:glycosyltransferase family 2 protein, partial [Patescibacteria group bacterium]|nr:glycosyltransferase family 2 protein [Patescibacteria group bacterium]
MKKIENNSLPKVSVVIPTYKRSHLIGRAVKSVLNQAYQNFEIIIIDDSPDDETEKIVKNFNDIRIKYTRNKIRRNFSGAKNQGVEESSPDSKYIAFLDDDDEYFPLFLEKTIRRLEKKKDVGYVITQPEVRLQNGERLRQIPGEWNWDETWNKNVGNGCVLRKEIFTKENIWFDEKCLFEDLDLGLRILQRFKGEFMSDVLRAYYYPLIKGESHSTSFTKETPSEEIEYFYKKNYQIYKKAGKKALAFVHFLTGKTFSKAGQMKKGRFHLLKAFQCYSRLEYLFYYLLALFFPKSFQSSYLII